jgi:hypothetical protein
MKNLLIKYENRSIIEGNTRYLLLLFTYVTWIADRKVQSE